MATSGLQAVRPVWHVGLTVSVVHGRGPAKRGAGRRLGSRPPFAARPGAVPGPWAPIPGQEGEPVQARTGPAAVGRDVTPLGSEPCSAYQARSVVRAWVWVAADAVPDS